MITIAQLKVKISLNCPKYVLLTIPQILYFYITTEYEFYSPTKAQDRNPEYLAGEKTQKIPNELDQRENLLIWGFLS